MKLVKVENIQNNRRQAPRWVRSVGGGGKVGGGLAGGGGGGKGEGGVGGKGAGDFCFVDQGGGE